MRKFVNLHAHTNLGSMLDALIDVNDLFDRVKELGQKAVAVTDHGTLAAHYDAFYAYKRTGVKFIPGCEMYFVNSYDYLPFEEGKRKVKRTEKRKHLVLLAQNYNGYKNLLKANFVGFRNHVVLMGRIYPRINWEDLEQYTDGLICTSACFNGPLSKLLFEGKDNEALEVANRLSSMFPNRFFIEIQPHLLKDNNVDQDFVNKRLIYIANKYGIPLIAALDVHYATQLAERYHDMLMAVKEKKPFDDPDRFRYGIDEFFVKSSDEVYDFLSKRYGHEIAEEAISNTVKVADMCEPPDYMETKGNHLPVFDASAEEDYEEFNKWRKNKMSGELKKDAEFMRFRIAKGFKEKFNHMSHDQRQKRFDSVKKELKILENNNFSSYMLVVADFIKWAKDNGILVGVGRGSVGGSMVGYLLGIHGVDPMEYGLLFERFQNAYKKDLPDIDTDFTSAGRNLVQEYCRKKYGVDHCAQVSNINTYTPKNIIPNLVKSMRNIMPELIPKGENYVKISNAIKDAIPDQDKDGKEIKLLEQAMETSVKLRKFAENSGELMEYADALIGLPKEYSTHAAGMVISDVPIIEFAPLRVDKNGIIAVQYEKNRCESIGLVKMDFLAISTLDIIDETFKNIERLGIDGPKRMEDIPLDDKETYTMIQQGHTKCVFQLGKSGMMVILCKLIKPENITDIAMVNALGRPSSSNKERKEYADRKFGRKEATYLHPSLKNALKETYGLGIFEEQLMAVAQDVAGWDLNKADELRKLTKLKGKNPKLALKLEVDFIEGAIKKHNVEYEKAKEIWDKVVLPFAGYGFNKSHAIFYSINGYITAYLKCHYPAAFLAAYLKIKTIRGGINKEDEIAMAKTECRRVGIKIVPPDINKSGAGYEVLDEGNIVMGLSAIKGVKNKALNEIVVHQPYDSLSGFFNSVNASVVNKTILEVLAKAGCFDSMNITRKSMYDEGKKVRNKMNVFLREKVKDGYDADMAIEEFSINFSSSEWSKQEMLKYEQEVLGELVSGSISDMYPGFFTGVNVTPISRLKCLPDRHNIIVEFLTQSMLREFKIKNGRYKGQMMAKYRVKDVYGTDTELTVWPDKYKMAKNIMIPGTPIRAQCQISEFNGIKTLILREIENIYGS